VTRRDAPVAPPGPAAFTPRLAPAEARGLATSAPPPLIGGPQTRRDAGVAHSATGPARPGTGTAATAGRAGAP
jgi:hypothetical protein